MLAEGQERVPSWGFGETGQVYLDAHLCRVALERGDLAGARARARAQRRDPAAPPTTSATGSAPSTSCCIAEGRLDEALAVADELERRFGAYVSPVAGRWRSHRALALDRLGRREEALALADFELEHARGVGRAGRDRPRAARPRHAARASLGDLEEAVARARRLGRPGSISPRRSSRSAGRCGATGGRPRRASRCAARSSCRGVRRAGAGGAGPPRALRRRRAAAHRRGGRGRGAHASERRVAGPRRGRARPTGTSPRRSSSRRRRSRCTSPTPTASSASGRAASWAPRSRRDRRARDQARVPTAIRYSFSKRAAPGLAAVPLVAEAVQRGVELLRAALLLGVLARRDRRAVARLEVLGVAAGLARTR